MIPIKSSAMVSAGYDAETRVLTIEHQKGRVLEYFAVPVAVYDGLVSSSSKGAFFNQHIRNFYRSKRKDG